MRISLGEYIPIIVLPIRADAPERARIRVQANEGERRKMSLVSDFVGDKRQSVRTKPCRTIAKKGFNFQGIGGSLKQQTSATSFSQRTEGRFCMLKKLAETNAKATLCPCCDVTSNEFT